MIGRCSNALARACSADWRRAFLAGCGLLSGPAPAKAASVPAGAALSAAAPAAAAPVEPVQYRRYYGPRGYYGRPRYARPYYRPRPYYYGRPAYRSRVVCRVRYTAYGPRRVCTRRW